MDFPPDLRQVRLMDLNTISSRVIRAAITVHKELGPGLLESVYQRSMAIELCRMGAKVQTEVPVAVFYRGEQVHEEGFRIDLLVDDCVVIELKSVEEIRSIHKKQLLTYLRISKKPLGLLINFNEVMLKNGITRVINTPTEGQSLA